MASEMEALEVFRLGLLARDSEIVRVVGDQLAGGWIRRSRFGEAEELTRRSLGVQTSPGTLGWAAWSRQVLGRPAEAIELNQQRLRLVREVGDRAGEAGTLNNLGGVYGGLGDRQAALRFYNEALPIFREVGDRAGEAATLNNLGSVYNGLGDRQAALRFYNEALPIFREVGDRAGEATILNNLGSVYNGLGDREAALRFYNEALPILREVGAGLGPAKQLPGTTLQRFTEQKADSTKPSKNSRPSSNSTARYSTPTSNPTPPH